MSNEYQCPYCSWAPPRLYDLKAERDAARQEAARLREALGRYGRHDIDCLFLAGVRKNEEAPCDCGYTAALTPATVCAECGSAKLLPAAGIGLVCSDCGSDKIATDAECQHEWVASTTGNIGLTPGVTCRHCGKRPEVQ